MFLAPHHSHECHCSSGNFSRTRVDKSSSGPGPCALSSLVTAGDPPTSQIPLLLGWKFSVGFHLSWS